MAGSSNDILIAVLGVTGAGKSTFISKATGRTDLAIGHSVRSCTKSIGFYSLPLNGRKITLIDTPGFDDSQRSDADILESIAQWLRDSYENNKLLTGVILLQEIDGNRVLGSEVRRTRLFENVLGQNAYRHVVIGTTMWDRVDYSRGMSNQRERSASREFWGSMVHGGAEVCRHDNTQESALFLIQKLLSKNQVLLQMQTELENGNGMVSSTSAGQYLRKDLDNTSEKVLRELRDLRSSLSDREIENRALRADIAELQSKYDDIRNQKMKLDYDRVQPEDAPAWIQAMSAVGNTMAAWIPIGAAALGGGISSGALGCGVM